MDIADRIRSLTPEQRAVLADRLGMRVPSPREERPASDGQRLVAYYELSGDPAHAVPLDDAAIRRHLQTQLPAHLVPTDYYCVERLPRLPNGKIDRVTLRDPAMRPLSDAKASRPQESTGVVSPRNEVERTLVEIISDVVACGVVDVHDSFFEIGGDSLLAMQVVSRAHQAGMPITIEQLLERQTVAKIVASIEVPEAEWQETDAAQVRLVPLRTSGSRPTLYFIHTLGEGFEYCRALLPHLGDDQPVYGISTLVDGQRLPEGDVTPYLEQLRRHQPHGPYFLAGIFCGGRAAFKIACQLREEGEQVAFVGLIHTLTDLGVFRNLAFRERLMAHWQSWRSSGWAHAFRRLGRITHRFRRGHEPLPLERIVAQRNFRFQASAYDGRTTLFRLLEVVPFVEPELGWQAMVRGGVDIVDIPGSWMDLFRMPYVRTLGLGARAAIDRAVDSPRAKTDPADR